MEPRIRSQRSIVPTSRPNLMQNQNCTDGSWYSISNVTGIIGSDMSDSTMIDYVVPDFRKRRANGEVFFNDLYSSRVTVSAGGSGGYHVVNTTPSCASPVKFWEHKIDGHVANRCVPNVLVNGVYMPQEATALSASDILRLQIEVSTEAQSMRGRSDSDLWESLAEYRQTLELLKNPLEKIRVLSSSIANSAKRSTTSRLLLKEISGGYLVHRYGILPLMKDIESILKSLSRVTGKQRKTSRSNGSLYATKQVTGTSTFDVYNLSYLNEVRDSVFVRAMSLDEVDLSFGSNLGFSTKGLITLPWELMTLSFVADWFANIGSYLGAHAPAPGYKQLGSCLVTRRVTSNGYTFSTTGLNSASWNMVTAMGGSVGIVRESTVRGPIAQPGLVIKSDFKFDKFTRSADAFALLASRFTKLSKLVGTQPNLSAFRQKKAYASWLNQPGVL